MPTLAYCTVLPKLDTMRPVCTLQMIVLWPESGWGRSACAGVAGVLIGTCGWASTGFAQAPDPLGTLLYTPAQRQAMGQARAKPESSAPAASVGKPTPARLDGVVARVHGMGTAWVDGKPLPQGPAPLARILDTDAMVGGQRLRVGQSLDPVTGTRTDMVAPGSIRRDHQRDSP